MVTAAVSWGKLRGAIPLLGILFSSCDESLPSRLEPQGTLAIVNVAATQGAGPGGIHVTISVDVRNVYEETFAGLLNVRGNIHIWWKRHPEIEANIPVSHRANLLLDPGERHFITERWFLMTDDRRDVLDLLNFSNGDIRFGVAYANPELFVVEVKVTLFEETGLLTSGPHEFTLQGWRTVE